MAPLAVVLRNRLAPPLGAVRAEDCIIRIEIIDTGVLLGGRWSAESPNSARRTCWFVFPAKLFKRLSASQLMKQAFSFLRIQFPGLQLVSCLAEVLKPRFVFRTKLLFKFDSQALSQRRALSRSRYGNLQRSALHHCRIIEIAELRNVHDIAKDSPPRGFLEDLFVKFRRGCRGHHNKHAVEVAWLKTALPPFNPIRLSPRTYSRSRIGSHHEYLRGCLDESCYL